MYKSCINYVFFMDKIYTQLIHKNFRKFIEVTLFIIIRYFYNFLVEVTYTGVCFFRLITLEVTPQNRYSLSGNTLNKLNTCWSSCFHASMKAKIYKQDYPDVAFLQLNPQMHRQTMSSAFL
jgi:hypothetical protein